MVELERLTRAHTRQQPSGAGLDLLRAWTQLRNAGADKPARRAPQIKRGVVNVEKPNFIDQRLEMKRAYEELRGFDIGGNSKKVPRTTNADVAQVIRYWSTSVVQFGATRTNHDEPAAQQWWAAVKRAGEHMAGKDPNDTYVDNEAFWQRDLARVAIWLNSLGAVPTKASLAWSAFTEAAVEAPGVVAGTVASVGKKAGEVAVAPIKGAAEAMGIGVGKLLLGAGLVVAGVLILPRVIK